MSEQAKILAELQEMIMVILKNGSASEAEADRIDELEALMQQQKCYDDIDHEAYSYKGEQIAGLFSTDQYMEAIDKMCEWEITPDDFFGFIGYDDEEEEFVDIFTDDFIAEVSKVYQAKCPSK